MKRFARFTVCFWFVGLLSPAQAAFTSLYAFGDGICTTTAGLGGQYYYGNRNCNGRVWIEVLCQQQGLTYDSNKNWSYYGQYSTSLVANVSTFVTTMPPDSTNSLFVIWVNDADFVADIGYYAPDSANLAAWTNSMNRSLTNHFKAVTNLFSHGARTFVMPTAVDITKIPFNSGLSAASKTFIRQRVIDYNALFTNSLMNQIATNCPGITVYVPDIFSLLDNVMTNAAAYGLTNAGIDAVDSTLTDKSLDGPGANYVFWDPYDPTARFQAVIAGVAQQMISQPMISKFTVLGGSNRLDMINVPVGLDGMVYGSSNFVNWTVAQSIDSSNTVESIYLPSAGPLQFYRLYFPFNWTWP